LLKLACLARSHDPRAARGFSTQTLAGWLALAQAACCHNRSVAYSLQVARSPDEVLALQDAWQSLAVPKVDADPQFFLSVIDERREAQRPHAVLVSKGGSPVALLAARLETISLETRFGYKALYSPRVRSLTAVPGGVLGADEQAVRLMVETVDESLRQREAEVLVLPYLRTDSPVFVAFQAAATPLRWQHLIQTRTHRVLRLPRTFDDFFASRTSRVRASVRRHTKRFNDSMGKELAVATLHKPGDFDRIFRDIVRVADTTYQRGLGVSFADTPERRRFVRISLEHGWFRAWVLYRRETPIAFMQGSVYAGVYHGGTTGYDPAYRKHQVGIYLLMRAIEDLCADPEVGVLDYGPGDAEYKRHFSDECWEERDVVVFAPSFRAVRINAARTAILACARAAEGGVTRLGEADRIKSRWRNHLGMTARPQAKPPSSQSTASQTEAARRAATVSYLGARRRDEAL
jgi:Acetyltransferase (GNAT) domain